jgi:hypothetical protein
MRKLYLGQARNNKMFYFLVSSGSVVRPHSILEGDPLQMLHKLL